MANYKQNKEFSEAIFPQYLLDDAIEWIHSNMEPDEVFSNEKLEAWAERSGFTQEE